MAAYTQYWTVITVLTLLISSYGLYFAYIWISDQFDEFTSYKTAGMLFATPNFYLAMVGCMGIVFGFDLFMLYLKTEFRMDLLEKVKLGIKRGYDRSESFFKELFEKKSTLQDADESSKTKIERMNSSSKKEKNDSSILKKNDMESFCRELIDNKQNAHEVHFKKVDMDVEMPLNS